MKIHELFESFAADYPVRTPAGIIVIVRSDTSIEVKILFSEDGKIESGSAYWTKHKSAITDAAIMAILESQRTLSVIKRWPALCNEIVGKKERFIRILLTILKTNASDIHTNDTVKDVIAFAHRVGYNYPEFAVIEKSIMAK
jgi:hypothetical protein